MKKALSLILVAGLALAGVPGWAQVSALVFGPNTVWGFVPQAASSAVNAALDNLAGTGGGMVPIVDGRFAFRDLPPGQYVVVLQTATGVELARSRPVDLASGAEVEALFGSDDTPAAAVPPGAGAAAAGLTTTQKIALAAGAVGLATVIIIAHNVASPSR
jgi:hypothetical protein